MMSRITAVVVLLAVFPVITINGQSARGSKYSKETQPDDDGRLLFRSKKGMMIWKKAQHKLRDDPMTLKSLKEELTVIDKDLMGLKQLKYQNDDPYGDAEAELDKRVHAMLVKYGMAGIDMRSTMDPKLSNKIEDHVKKDSRLDSLYDKAVKLGFTAEELEQLKNEILHHKLKMVELDALISKYSAVEEQVRVETNVVEKKEGHDAPAESAKLNELKGLIKDKKKEIGESMNRLGLLSDNPDLAKDAVFTQRKVLQLWNDILKANFTAEERASLRQELMHLENKMNKRDKLNHEEALLDKHHDEQGHKSDKIKRERYLEKKDKIKERSEQLDKHVNKYVKDLNARVNEKRHSEL